MLACRGMTGTRSLAGPWRFRPDPSLLGELFPEELHYTHAPGARWMRPDLDDDGWDEVQVPHSWPRAEWRVAWYRRRFDAPALSPGERAFLVFDGVYYLAEVWLNGRCLGSHEGYFGAFEFEVTELLREDNVVAVRVESPIDAPGTRNEIGQLKTVFKGALNRWDMNDPEFVPGGLWRDVRLECTGPARLGRLRASGAPSGGGAFVTVQADVDLGGTEPVDAELELRLLGPDGAPVHAASDTRRLAPGANPVSAVVTLEDPALWWPWDLGRPDLHTAVLTVRAGDTASEARARFGIRSVERDGSGLLVNGVPCFQRGANYLSDIDLARMDRARYARDVELLRGANLNTVHPFCVVERPEFYELCDEQGLVVYQDFPVWLEMDPSGETLRRAQAQVLELVETLFNHPSVCIINLASQPSRAQFEKASSALALTAARADRTRVVSQANATFAYTDGYDTHPVRSFFWPLEYGEQAHRRQDWRWDAHLYAGWYFGEADDLETMPEDHLRLVTEFGAQALPDAASLRELLGDAAWPPHWPAYAARGAQPELLSARAHGETLEELVERSQDYQAQLVRAHVEFYRRHKGRPCHGAHVFCFNDCWPSISWSLVQHDRTPKAAYDALRRAMAPVQAFLAGEQLAVTVVNDTREAIDATLRWVVDGSAIAERPVAVPALGLTDVDSPAPRPAGALELQLLVDGEPVAVNPYER